MNAEIIAVGTELLLGNIVNTNAQYLSERLSEAGIDVFYQSVVGDNPNRLRSCLEQALSRADLLVVTGGLGPTQDDLTKETAAELETETMTELEQVLEMAAMRCHLTIFLGRQRIEQSSTAECRKR